jgi:hypothetical protein
MRPHDRLAAIQGTIERELQARKEQDHHWEDQIDVSKLYHGMTNNI